MAIIPGLVLVGAASSPFLLYLGLALYSFGWSIQCHVHSQLTLPHIASPHPHNLHLVTHPSLVSPIHRRHTPHSPSPPHPAGAGTIVPSLTTIVSRFGEGDEKGRVMGIFRSLGALARALGPFAASTGEPRSHSEQETDSWT